MTEQPTTNRLSRRLRRKYCHDNVTLRIAGEVLADRAKVPKMGRPSLGDKRKFATGVSLTKEQQAKARRIGAGNVSAGIADALANAADKPDAAVVDSVPELRVESAP